MRKIEELDIYQPGDGATAGELSILEEHLNLTLPGDYRMFMEHVNGGYPRVGTFVTENGSEWTVNNFFSISHDPLDTETLLWNYSNLSTNFSTKFLPFAGDPLGNLFLLRIQEPSSGSVWVWDHESDSFAPIKLTDSFEAFIDQLAIDSEN